MAPAQTLPTSLLPDQQVALFGLTKLAAERMRSAVLGTRILDAFAVLLRFEKRRSAGFTDA